MITDNSNYLWVEKYRPQTISDCVLPENIKLNFQEVVDAGELQNLLLSGGPGCGKTTVAKALCKELDTDWILINCSEDGNIDTLRTKIRQFASTISISGNKKAVILDEFDYSNCVDDDEVVLLSNGSYQKLKDMKIGEEYGVVSYNTTTNKFENDTAYRSSSGDKELYEIEFEDGSKCRVTADHILICTNNEGIVVERCINDGFEGVLVVALR